MRLPGAGRLRRWLHLATAPFQWRGVILLYHRICDLPSDPQLLCVSPRHFAEHLEYLRRHHHLMTLEAVVQGDKDLRFPKHAVVVTLDDGYADNLWNAKPLLEQYDVSATVFVVTGMLGQGREFWWDELDKLLLQPGTLPPTLHLTVKEHPCPWELGEASHYTEEDFGHHRGWNILKEESPTARHQLYRELLQLLRPLPSDQQQKILGELRTWARADSTGRLTHRTLTPTEVLRLSEGGLITIGSHTVSHSVLSGLPAAAQRVEIQQSKTDLEGILGCQITSFSYPYGSPSDYTSQTVTFVQDTGFACACSNVTSAVWHGSDRFQLPRMLVRDWDVDTFARRLSRWFWE